MLTAILSFIGSIIVGVLALIGVIITNNKSQAVMEIKLENLSQEVRKHNNFGTRIPVMEEQIKEIFVRLNKVEDERVQ